LPRSSRADTARHHEAIIDAASRLIRERGVESVTLPEVMGEIGLTKGGFYKHFESKEALVVTAIQACWSEELNRLAQFATEHPDDPAARRSAFLDWYLSAEHRDDPGTGCPSVLAGAVARSEPDSALRTAYIAGIYQLLALNGADNLGTDPDEWQIHVLGEMATLGGALMMARATAGDPLSDTILTAVRRHLG
jgi:TetR/AcrR family transcriptional repressor of nem operon